MKGALESGNPTLGAMYPYMLQILQHMIEEILVSFLYCPLQFFCLTLVKAWNTM